jgi:hypothetical protein
MAGRAFGYVRNAFLGELQSNRNLPAPDCRFPAPDLETSMVKLVALLTTFSVGIFLEYAIEAYSDKAYRAHFSETHDLGVTKPGVDPCDVRNDVEDLTKDCPGFREALKMQDFITRTDFPP